MCLYADTKLRCRLLVFLIITLNYGTVQSKAPAPTYQLVVEPAAPVFNQLVNPVPITAYVLPYPLVYDSIQHTLISHVGGKIPNYVSQITSFPPTNYTLSVNRDGVSSNGSPLSTETESQLLKQNRNILRLLKRKKKKRARNSTTTAIPDQKPLSEDYSQVQNSTGKGLYFMKFASTVKRHTENLFKEENTLDSNRIIATSTIKILKPIEEDKELNDIGATTEQPETSHQENADSPDEILLAQDSRIAKIDDFDEVFTTEIPPEFEDVTIRPSENVSTRPDFNTTSNDTNATLPNEDEDTIEEITESSIPTTTMPTNLSDADTFNNTDSDATSHDVPSPELLEENAYNEISSTLALPVATPTVPTVESTTQVSELENSELLLIPIPESPKETTGPVLLSLSSGMSLQGQVADSKMGIGPQLIKLLGKETTEARYAPLNGSKNDEQPATDWLTKALERGVVFQNVLAINVRNLAVGLSNSSETLVAWRELFPKSRRRIEQTLTPKTSTPIPIEIEKVTLSKVSPIFESTETVNS